MESHYFVGSKEKINIEENNSVEFLPISNEINTSFSFNNDVDLYDLEMFVDNYLCCHRDCPFIYIFKNEDNGYKLIKYINIYENYIEKDFGYDADEYPYDLYKTIVNSMSNFINENIDYDTAFKFMQEKIDSGNIEQPLDFYGYFLTYYNIEDSKHTRNIFGGLYDKIKSDDYQRLLIAADGLVRSDILLTKRSMHSFTDVDEAIKFLHDDE